jgi:hypothetical protein
MPTPSQNRIPSGEPLAALPGATHVYSVSIWAALFPAIAILLAVLKVFGPLVLTEDQTRLLTQSGRFWVHPERDLPIYCIGCAFCIGVGALFFGREFRPNRPARLSLLLGCVVLLLEFVLWSVPSWLPRNALQMAVGIAGGSCIAWSWSTSRRSFGPKDSVLNEGFDTGKRFPVGWADAAVVVGLFLFLVVKDAPQVAGRFFATEEMHHWDFFAMAPTLGFQGGSALGRDVYTQYGVGWPLLFAMLARLVPLSYALMITTASVWGAAYWSASYFLVRYFSCNRLFSLAVTVVGVTMSLFWGLDRGTIIWCWPSSTPLRAPLDILLLLCAATYLHRRTLGWAITSGLMLGLSAIFETDTGIFLSVSFITFWAALLWVDPSLSRLRHFSLSSCAAILTSFAGFTIAGRALPDLRFLKGLIEGITAASGGLGSLPIADLGVHWVAAFAMMVLVYTGAVGLSLGKLAHRRSGSFDIWVLTSGTYGLLTLLVFVGRSHPYNLFHVCGYFVVFSALLLASYLSAGHFFRSVPDPARSQTLLSRAAVGMFLIAAVALGVSPGFAAYPGFWNPRGPRQTTVSLRSQGKDLTNLPEAFRAYSQDFKEATEYLRRRSEEGQSVAVLDCAGTVFYLESGVRPWGRYCPPFQIKSTFKADVEDFQATLMRSKPELVVMSRNMDSWHRKLASESWRRTRETVVQSYSLKREFGLIEIWELR